MPDGEASDTRDELDRSIEIAPQWGKLNQGQRFNIIALDVHRALSAAGLGKYETILFEQAQEEGWHEAVKTKKGPGDAWPDPRPARLNIYKLAQRHKVDVKRFREAKKSLLNSRIFLETEGHAVFINKNAHEWIHPTSKLPRLTPETLEWCDDARPKTRQRPSQIGMSAGPEKRPETGPEKRPETGPEKRPEQVRKSAPIHIEERTRGDSIQSTESFCETQTHKNGQVTEEDEYAWLEEAARATHEDTT
jgi:hypothetical protein